MPTFGLDETALQRRHEYVTVVNDVRAGRVVYVGDGRTLQVLEQFFAQLTPAQRAREGVAALDGLGKPVATGTDAGSQSKPFVAPSKPGPACS